MSSSIISEVSKRDNVVMFRKMGFFCDFLDRLLNPKFHYIRDLYPTMFFLDVICFLIVAVGYSEFGEVGSGNVLRNLEAIFL